MKKFIDKVYDKVADTGKKVLSSKVFKENIMSAKEGKIVQVMGPVIDVSFDEGQALPEIYTALTITNPAIDDTEDNLVLEVSLHVGDNMVRCVAMDSSEGLRRGMPVKNTGAPITVPVGENILGRILDCLLYTSPSPRDQRGSRMPSSA